MSRADLLLTLEWESAAPAGPVRHRDHLFAAAVDLERDRLPEALKAALAGAAAGETASVPVDGIPGGAILETARDAFRERRADGSAVAPKAGRFYPAAHFSGVSSAAAAIRCVGLDGNTLTVDTRHPLADHAVTLSARVLGRLDTAAARQPVDWGGALANGPGLQACWRGQATEFLDDTAYARPDEGADPDFYAPPRITAHLDSRAQQVVGRYYSRFIPEDGRVLDLMSSAHSNLARDQRLGSLIGLGLNAREMRANARLDGAVIGDLNAGQAMPFADSVFDAAICTVSIDYLTDPVRTVGEVARVLKPGAPFAVAFSNRWFPPKVTRLWTELDPFEQMALVVQYFDRRFAEIETASFRGYPRPMDDAYYRYTAEADPVFAVAGRAKG